MKIGKYDYERCTVKMQCPICGKQKWCMVSVDGKWAICGKTSEGAVKHYSYGHLHKISGQIEVKVTKSPPPILKPKEYIKAVYSRMASGITCLEPLALSLGLQAAVLLNLGARKFPDKDVWGFPMYTDRGEMIGIKCRNLARKKWCVKGSQLGLYIPWVYHKDKPLVVCEGESDTAAALQMGYNTLGRPSVTCGQDYIQGYIDNNTLIKNKGTLKIYVAADRDESGIGLKEAGLLADKLNPKGTVLYNPAYKDLREWMLSGEKIVLAP